jgi:hypothetical protein
MGRSNPVTAHARHPPTFYLAVLSNSNNTPALTTTRHSGLDQDKTPPQRGGGLPHTSYPPTSPAWFSTTYSLRHLQRHTFNNDQFSTTDDSPSGIEGGGVLVYVVTAPPIDSAHISSTACRLAASGHIHHDIPAPPAMRPQGLVAPAHSTDHIGQQLEKWGALKRQSGGRSWGGAFKFEILKPLSFGV